MLDLSDPLLRSIDYYDEDGEDFINQLYDTTVNITIAYSILNILFYFFVLFGQLKQLNACLVAEVKLFRIFQKDDDKYGTQGATVVSTQGASKLAKRDKLTFNIDKKSE